jgi:hypothetical protein
MIPTVPTGSVPIENLLPKERAGADEVVAGGVDAEADHR